MSSQLFNQQHNIIPGQITKFRDVYYRAEKKLPHTPCFAQCDCTMPAFSISCGCSGFCYRWANGDGIVFKKVNERELPTIDFVIVETKFAAACREHGGIMANLKDEFMQ